ncbi:unnamed protein product [Discula destructiva]
MSAPLPINGTDPELGWDGPSQSGDLGPMVMAVCWTMTGVAAIFLGLRLYVKLTAHRKLYWDDFLLVASWLALVAFSGMTVNGVYYGLGQHNALNKFHDNGSQLQLTVVIATVFSVLGAAWSKTSFAITLLRLTQGVMHWIIWFAIVSMNIILVFNAVLQFLRCQPAWAAWNSGLGGSCWNKNVIVYYSIAAASYSAAMDILLAMVPWVVIMSLRMHIKEKIGVAVCMSLGIVAAMTSIMRAVHIPDVYTEDYTWNESQLFVWTAAELATTIIAASIPVLRTLLRDILISTQRRDGKTGATNTFKTGTYMCSTVGRAQSYRRMTGDMISQKPGGGHLNGISEDVESLNSLPRTPEKSLETGRDHGGIMKTEEVEVQYGRASRNGLAEAGGIKNPVLGFELDEIPATYVRSKSRWTDSLK